MAPPRGPRELITGPDAPEAPFPLYLSGKVIKGFGRGSKELGIPTANIPIEGLSVGGHSDLESGVYYGWAGLDFHDSSSSNSADGGVPTASVDSGRGDHSGAQQQQQSKDNSAATLADRVKHAGGKVAGAVGSALFGGSGSESAESGGQAGGHGNVTKEAAAAASAAESKPTNGSGSGSSSNRSPTNSNKENIYPMAMSIGWNPFYKNTVRSVEVHIMHDFPSDFYGSHLNLVVLGFIRPELDYVSKEALIDDIRTDIEVARRSLARPAYAALKKDPYLLDFPKDEHGNVLKDDVAK
ncbi:riboflavin kinase-domain-containing protein [Phyllosticta citrichinensis]|uniref:Riboflavin kinase n=1 Tax=Phyllosticta citrichinensis TaxID=1130410 RepID=A0ABR1Y7L1_9PEZI